MKPELQAAIERLSKISREAVWHKGTIRVRQEDLKLVLDALKPVNPGIAVPNPEVHGSLNIKTFTPPEDFLEQIHEQGVADLLATRS
jgi:hypothetical protein